MGNKHDVKEIKELISGLELLATSAAGIMKDGKIGVDDLPVVINLLGSYSTLSESFKGLSLIDDEIANMDEAELVEVVKAIFGLGQKIKGLL